MHPNKVTLLENIEIKLTIQYKTRLAKVVTKGSSNYDAKNVKQTKIENTCARCGRYLLTKKNSNKKNAIKNYFLQTIKKKNANKKK